MRQQFSIIVLFLFSIVYHSLSQPALQKADKLFYAHEQKEGPGLAINVSMDAKVLYKNQVGYANLEHRIPITDATRFLVGSISKQFTVYAMLLLAEQGQLSIDDPITKYLPELKDLNKKITIRMLANHTNGFRNNTELNGLRGRSDEELISQEEMVSVLLRQRGLNFEPGERFQYNNAGYTLLAEIISRVSGQDFSDYVAQHIFQPLGMQNSQFRNSPTNIIKQKANSYYRTDAGYQYYPMNRSIVGSTGLHTTTDDLIKWTSNFNNPRIGNKAIFSKMIEASHLNSGESIPYGLGLETKMYRGLRVVFHGGGDAGFRAYLLYIPQFNFTVAVSGNYEAFNPLDIAYGMVDIFLEKYLTPDLPEQVPALSTQQLAKYAGTYQVFPGLYIKMIAEKDSLFFQHLLSEDRLYLPAITEKEFKFSPRQHSKFVFGKDGMVWHFSDFSYPAIKVMLEPIDYKQISIAEYLGEFYSSELQTTYTFVKKDGKILAQHPFNPDYELIPIDEDSFITNSSNFSRADFIRDDKHNITACQISGQDAWGIRFVKIP